MKTGISIHALLAESDAGPYSFFCPECRFQSTLSLRRATDKPVNVTRPSIYFNPRSPCGERLLAHVPTLLIIWISIHALLAESDS